MQFGKDFFKIVEFIMKAIQLFAAIFGNEEDCNEYNKRNSKPIEPSE